MERQLNEALAEKCLLLHRSTLVELGVYDEELTLVRQFRSHEIPVFLTDYIHENLKEIAASIAENGTDKVYYYTNSLFMSFICVGVTTGEERDGYVICGPFLLTTDYRKPLRQWVHTAGMAPDSLVVLEQYFESLQLLQSPQKEYLGRLIHNTIHNNLIGSRIHHELSSEAGLSELMKSWKYEGNLEALKAHKRFEEKLLYAIERGLKSEALKIHAQRDFSMDSVMYLNNSFRNGKNILMVANTLYARAAYKGGVSLSYSDSLSSKFIVLIERSKSMEDLQQLSKKMIIDYCECVNSFAIKGYTPIVRQTMDYIQQRLNEPISLQSVAKYLKLNKSYLSKLFGDEVGMTLTDYIHDERIKRACYILEYEHMSMTDIASVVGYSDPNYFTRVFKKYKGMTPSQYLKKIH